MKVYLSALSEEPKHLHFSHQDVWFIEAIQETQESNHPPASKESYFADFELKKSQDIVFIKVHLHADIALLCSRCASSFLYPFDNTFRALFTRTKSLSGTESNNGIAYSSPSGSTEDDLDITYLDKEYIELALVLQEQIYLKLPYQPLCHNDCKGLCPTCGQDQNKQPCQCYRLRNTSMANALKNFLD